MVAYWHDAAGRTLIPFEGYYYDCAYDTFGFYWRKIEVFLLFYRLIVLFHTQSAYFISGMSWTLRCQVVYKVITVKL